MYLVAVLQGSRGMEWPPSSERAPAVRRDDDRESAHTGTGVDGEG